MAENALIWHPPIKSHAGGGYKYIYPYHPPISEKTPMPPTKSEVELLAAIRENPVLFVEQILGAKPQKWQRKA